MPGFLTEPLRAIDRWAGVISSNITDVNLPGFKLRRITFTDAGVDIDRLPEPTSLAGGVAAGGRVSLMMPVPTLNVSSTPIDFSQGTIEQTGAETDFAIKDRTGAPGSNFFLLAKDFDASGLGQHFVLYVSRDGEFHWTDKVPDVARPDATIGLTPGSNPTFYNRYNADGSLNSQFLYGQVPTYDTPPKPTIVVPVPNPLYFDKIITRNDGTSFDNTVAPSSNAGVTQAAGTTPAGLFKQGIPTGPYLVNSYGLYVTGVREFRDSTQLPPNGQTLQVLPVISESFLHQPPGFNDPPVHPMVINVKFPQDLPYSEYGANVFTFQERQSNGGVPSFDVAAGAATLPLASNGFKYYRASPTNPTAPINPSSTKVDNDKRANVFADLEQGALERANYTLMPLFPEMSQVQRTFVSISKIITVLTANMDAILNTTR